MYKSKEKGDLHSARLPIRGVPTPSLAYLQYKLAIITDRYSLRNDRKCSYRKRMYSSCKKSVSLGHVDVVQEHR